MSLENRELGGLVHVHQNTSKLRRAFIFIGFGIVVFIIAGFVDDDNSFLFYFVGFMVALVGLFSLPIALASR